MSSEKENSVNAPVIRPRRVQSLTLKKIEPVVFKDDAERIANILGESIFVTEEGKLYIRKEDSLSFGQEFTQEYVEKAIEAGIVGKNEKDWNRKVVALLERYSLIHEIVFANNDKSEAGTSFANKNRDAATA